MKAAILAMCLAAAPPILLAADRPPNLVLFLIDDQDYESIACYGGETWTPQLDRMAAEGMRFTQAHVSSTVCTPSRYSFLTGRYAGNSTSKLYVEACGGTDTQGAPNFNMAVEADRMNVGAVLSRAGYATGFVGKFHVASEMDFPAFHQGDQGFRAVPRQGLKAGPEATALLSHNESVARRYIGNLGFTWVGNVYRGNLHRAYSQHNPEWTLEAALKFIRTNRDRPFYLHVCSTLLHGPDRSWRRSMDHPLVSGKGDLRAPPDGGMTPREDLLRALRDKGLDPDEGGVAGEAWIDDALGAILRTLRELRLADNTLVVFVPDHGSRSKGSLFSQDGVRVPMIAWWPGRIPGGLVCDELVQNIDWVPTAFDLAGVTPPPGYRIDGRSLVPLFDDGSAEGWRDHLYFELGPARAVATRRWKYIAVRYPKETVAAIREAPAQNLPRLMSYLGRLGIGTRAAVGRPNFWDADQLYDLDADPGETRNLAAELQHADQLARMKTLLRGSVRSMDRPFGEFAPGGNAAPPGQVDEQVAVVRTCVIDGKTVTVPGAE